MDYFTRKELREILLYCGVPIIFLYVATAFDSANLGIRRVLPAFPFAFVLIGITGVTHDCHPCRHLHRALVAWCAIVAWVIYPHHLSFFNAPSGGPTRGPYLLEDSNVDWGQDLPALAAWQREHQPGEPIKLFYFGTVPPELYGIRHLPIPLEEIVAPEPIVYAISAHQLVYIRKIAKQTKANIDWLTKYRPFDRAGYSIYLYRFPQE